MKIDIVNNHILAKVQTNLGQKTCVVDTGSPITFFFDEVTAFEIDSSTHEVSPLTALTNFAVNRNEIENLIGQRIDGFIGSDLMRRYGDVFIDFPSYEIHFGENFPSLDNVLQMDVVMGVPVFNVSFNKLDLRTAFDSGAMYSFVSQATAQEINLEKTGETLQDFHPGFGAYEIELFKGNVSIGKVNLGMHLIGTAPHYNEVLRLLGVGAFIGIDTLKENSILLSYARKEISIK